MTAEEIRSMSKHDAQMWIIKNELLKAKAEGQGTIVIDGDAELMTSLIQAGFAVSIWRDKIKITVP